MFENAGSKVKTLANIVLVLGIIVAVVCLIIGIASGELFVVCLLAAAVEVLTAWITGMILAAVGEAAENSKEALAKVCELSLNNTATVADGKGAAAGNIPEWKRVQMAIKEWTPVDSTEAIPSGESNICCTNCGKVQFKGNKTCSRCGARFIDGN